MRSFAILDVEKVSAEGVNCKVLSLRGEHAGTEAANEWLATRADGSHSLKATHVQGPERMPEAVSLQGEACNGIFEKS